MTKRQKQETILASFTRQQKPHVKRPKVNALDRSTTATTISAADIENWDLVDDDDDQGRRGDEQQQQKEEDEDAMHLSDCSYDVAPTSSQDMDGSMTDADVCSSQEDAVSRADRHRAVPTRTSRPSVVASRVPFPRAPFPPMPLHTTKGVMDSVHGMIRFEPICWRIIDTLQFQRLRHLHQLGAASMVYIGGTHSRFEHCLGVAHLAERMIKSIGENQPYLDITKADILCVKLAGLCHDLGHGPFSHVFDGIYMKLLKKSKRLQETEQWTHECGSLDMFDHLLRDNCINPEDYGLQDGDIIFIKEMIYGGPLPGSKGLMGRTDPNKLFLYDIVNNAKSGLDVDKLDYFLRDSQQTGIKSSCDVRLLIENARVLVDRDDPHHQLAICFPEKFVGQLMMAFKTRFQLHQTVYQHKNIRAAEYMLCDALLAADEHIKIKNCRISDIVHKPEAYQHLDDRVLSQIQVSDSPELEPARMILYRMIRRDIYDYVGKTAVTPHSAFKSEDMLRDEVLRCSVSRALLDEKHSVIVELVCVHHGKGKHDPVQFVRFYSKNSTSNSSCYQLPEESYRMHLPSSFEEQSIRVFVKESRLLEPVRRAFETWTERYNLSTVIPSCLSADSGEAQT